MSINLILPFISTAIMLYFVISVLQRYFATKQLHFLFWGMGLAMFGLGSFAEAYLAIAWNKWVFASWYYFGAVLNAAWIGHGTLHLMVRKKWRHGVTVLLVLGSLYAGSLMLEALPTFDKRFFTEELPISEQYGTKVDEIGEDTESFEEIVPVIVSCLSGEVIEGGNPPEFFIQKIEEYCSDTGADQLEIKYEVSEINFGVIPRGAPVRLTTPLMNIYGLLSLVGGAIYSAYLFWRKRVLPNRVIGNILIAIGALLIGGASVLTRLGYGQFLYVAELLSAIIMFIGFRVTARPQVNAEVNDS